MGQVETLGNEFLFVDTYERKNIPVNKKECYSDSCQEYDTQGGRDSLRGKHKTDRGGDQHHQHDVWPHVINDKASDHNRHPARADPADTEKKQANAHKDDRTLSEGRGPEMQVGQKKDKRDQVKSKKSMAETDMLFKKNIKVNEPHKTKKRKQGHAGLI